MAMLVSIALNCGRAGSMGVDSALTYGLSHVCLRPMTFAHLISTLRNMAEPDAKHAMLPRADDAYVKPTLQECFARGVICFAI